MNDRLTHKNSYDYPIVASDLLTTPDDLRLCLSTYLLMAKVGQLSPATISNYRYMCGKFVDFCQEHGVTKPAQITSIHLGLFLQQLQLTNGPQSVTDYFKHTLWGRLLSLHFEASTYLISAKFLMMFWTWLRPRNEHAHGNISPLFLTKLGICHLLNKWGYLYVKYRTKNPSYPRNPNSLSV